MSKRVQRKRTKGWRMPENAVYVGRGSRWGNPFVVGDGYTREEAVAAYRELMKGREAEVREHLRGKDLACWCSLALSCHADVLLEMLERPI